MKAKAWIAIGILLIAVVSGIAIAISVSSKGTEKNDNKENQFDAKVTEIRSEYLMVEALDGQLIAGEVQVWIGNLSSDDIPKLQIGDTVRITHDGKMTMSLPPQMSAVGKIEVIK